VKGTLRRKALAFFKRRTRKGNRWCLFIWGWTAVYMPLSAWNIFVSDDPLIRLAYGFTMLAIGAMVGMHYAGHEFRRTNSLWHNLAVKQRRLIDRMVAHSDAHRYEHTQGWWRWTEKGEKEANREH
jgi:hypothetical protein